MDLKFFFPIVNEDKLKQLKLTEEGKYSITRPAQGYQIANIIKKYIPNSTNYSFLDGTAGMGGDLYYIAPLFKYAVGIEKNAEHSQITNSNLTVLEVKNVKIRNMSIIDYLSEDSKEFNEDFPSKTIDVLWIDPPWGGPDYKKQKQLRFKMGGYDLDVLAEKLDVNKLLIFKLPFNYDFSEFNNFNYKLYKINKYFIIIILL